MFQPRPGAEGEYRMSDREYAGLLVQIRKAAAEASGYFGGLEAGDAMWLAELGLSEEGARKVPDRVKLRVPSASQTVDMLRVLREWTEVAKDCKKRRGVRARPLHELTGMKKEEDE